MKTFRALIQQELHKLIRGQADSVPSPELITLFLVAHYAQTGMKRELVDEKNLAEVIELEVERSKEISSPYIAQYLVMNKVRDEVNEDENYLHYFAIHAEFHAGKAKLIALDHYAGHAGDLSHFKASPLVSSKKVTLYIAGGDILQTDIFSCAYFAFDALDVAGKIPDIFKRCADASNKENEVDWKKLSPELVRNAQSLSYLFQYIDRFRRHRPYRRLPITEEIPILAYPAPGQEKSFAEYLSKGITTLENSHVINDSIRIMAAASLAESTLAFLDTIESEQALIQMLYEKDYPHVYLLMRELNEKFQEKSIPHPLMKFIFSDCEKFETKLKNEYFSTIVHNPNIQTLMLDTKIAKFLMQEWLNDKTDLYSQHLEKCMLILTIGEALEEIDYETFKEILSSPSITSSEYPEIRDMLQTDLLSIEDALYILPRKINPTIWEELKGPEEKLKYLKSSSVSPHHPENKPSAARLLGASMSAVLAPNLSDFLEEALVTETDKVGTQIATNVL